MTQEEVWQLLRIAASAEVGVLIRVTGGSLAAAKTALYKAKAAGGREFSELQIRTSPFAEGELVLVKAGNYEVIRPPVGGVGELL